MFNRKHSYISSPAILKCNISSQSEPGSCNLDDKITTFSLVSVFQMALSSSFCFLLLLSAVSAQDDYWYPDIDVPQSIQTLTQEELDAVIATKTVIVHFVSGSTEGPAVNKMTTYTRRMLQVKTFKQMKQPETHKG